MPEHFADTCRESHGELPGDLTPRDVFATAECHPSGIQEVQFHLVHTTEWMTMTFRELMDDNDVRPSIHVADRLNRLFPELPAIEGSGDETLCENGISAGVANVWSAGESDEAHVESPEPPQEDSGMAADHMEERPRGFVACYRDSEGLNTLVWTDTQTKILSIATGTQPRDLYNWWRDEAGPVLEAHTAADGSGEEIEEHME